MDTTRLTTTIIAWYDRHARDLPWRAPDASPWAVMVSEFMLQQTPVGRVLEPWRSWLDRWPTPSALAAEPVGEAIRVTGEARVQQNLVLAGARIMDGDRILDNGTELSPSHVYVGGIDLMRVDRLS